MKLEFLYLAFAIIFCFVYYSVNKKLIFDKHVHSKTLVRAMTANLVFNIFMTVAVAFLLFTTDGKVVEFLLRTPNVKNTALLLLTISAYLIVVVTVIVGARISLKRKGHKNLKLERILTSDFSVCAACGGIATIAFFIGIVVQPMLR